MSQQELLASVVSFLSKNKIEYMTTGSVVSSLQGQPRLTHDVDIVVNVKKENVQPLLDAFPPPRFYLSEDAINDAIDRNFMFNLLDSTTGDKVDFWLLTNDPFDTLRFSRRYLETVPGFSMYVSSPEDTVLMKLKWCKLYNGSEKQFGDAKSVYELQFGRLDLGYIKQWVEELRLDDLWHRLVIEAMPLI